MRDFFLSVQALDVDPATGLLEGDEDEEGFEEEYPLEQLNIATADFMAKVTSQLAPPLAAMHTHLHPYSGTPAVVVGCLRGCLSGQALGTLFLLPESTCCFYLLFVAASHGRRVVGRCSFCFVCGAPGVGEGGLSMGLNIHRCVCAEAKVSSRIFFSCRLFVRQKYFSTHFPFSVCFLHFVLSYCCHLSFHGAWFFFVHLHARFVCKGDANLHQR